MYVKRANKLAKLTLLQDTGQAALDIIMSIEQILFSAFLSRLFWHDHQSKKF